MDVFLHVVNLAVFPSLMAALGIFLAIKDLKEKKELWITMFVILFVGAVFLAIISERRADQVQNARDNVISNMYSQVITLVQYVIHPASNPEHQAMAVSLQAIQQQLKVPPPVVIHQPPSLASPEEALRRMSSGQLRDYVNSLADKMMDFESSYMTREFTQLFNQFSVRPSDPAEGERIQQARSTAMIQSAVDHENEYKKHFWADVRSVYLEMLRRYKEVGTTPPAIPSLPASASLPELVPVTIEQGRLSGPRPIEAVAQYLRILARSLPA